MTHDEMMADDTFIRRIEHMIAGCGEAVTERWLMQRHSLSYGDARGVIRYARSQTTFNPAKPENMSMVTDEQIKVAAYRVRQGSPGFDAALEACVRAGVALAEQPVEPEHTCATCAIMRHSPHGPCNSCTLPTRPHWVPKPTEPSKES